MKVSNGVYKEVTIDWANVSLPLKEGSPVSLAGVVANNGNAIGLVPQNYLAEPLMKSIYVLVGGDVDLAEVNTLAGITLSSAAKGNMSGIRFWKTDGTVDDSADASLPSVTADDNGDVLTVVSGAWAKATPSSNVACLFIQPSGWSGDAHALGTFGCCENINNKWVLMEDWYSDVSWEGNVFVATPIIPIPPASANKKIFWAIYLPELDDVVMNLSGDISQTPITVYDPNGASQFVGYEITGMALAELTVN